jgi:hypothetical protein
MDFDLDLTISKHPACRFPGSSQAGTQRTIDGDVGEQGTHRVRLRPSFLIERDAIRIRDQIAVVIDVVDHTVPKQIYAAALGAIDGYTPGLHFNLRSIICNCQVSGGVLA